MGGSQAHDACRRNTDVIVVQWRGNVWEAFFWLLVNTIRNVHCGGCCGGSPEGGAGGSFRPSEVVIDRDCLCVRDGSIDALRMNGDGTFLETSMSSLVVLGASCASGAWRCVRNSLGDPRPPATVAGRFGAVACSHAAVDVAGAASPSNDDVSRSSINARMNPRPVSTIFLHRSLSMGRSLRRMTQGHRPTAADCFAAAGSPDFATNRCKNFTRKPREALFGSRTWLTIDLTGCTGPPRIEVLCGRGQHQSIPCER